MFIDFTSNNKPPFERLMQLLTSPKVITKGVTNASLFANDLTCDVDELDVEFIDYLSYLIPLQVHTPSKSVIGYVVYHKNEKLRIKLPFNHNLTQDDLTLGSVLVSTLEARNPAYTITEAFKNEDIEIVKIHYIALINNQQYKQTIYIAFDKQSKHTQVDIYQNNRITFNHEAQTANSQPTYFLIHNAPENISSLSDLTNASFIFLTHELTSLYFNTSEPLFAINDQIIYILNRQFFHINQTQRTRLGPYTQIESVHTNEKRIHESFKNLYQNIGNAKTIQFVRRDNKYVYCLSQYYGVVLC